MRCNPAFKEPVLKLSLNRLLVQQWRGDLGGAGGNLSSDNFQGALKSKGGTKTRNCQFEI